MWAASNLTVLFAPPSCGWGWGDSQERRFTRGWLQGTELGLSGFATPAILLDSSLHL